MCFFYFVEKVQPLFFCRNVGGVVVSGSSGTVTGRTLDDPVLHRPDPGDQRLRVSGSSEARDGTIRRHQDKCKPDNTAVKDTDINLQLGLIRPDSHWSHSSHYLCFYCSDISN